MSKLKPIRAKPTTKSDTKCASDKGRPASDLAQASPEIPEEVNTCPRCKPKSDGTQPKVGTKRKYVQRQSKACCDVGIKSVLRAIRTFVRNQLLVRAASFREAKPSKAQVDELLTWFVETEVLPVVFKDSQTAGLETIQAIKKIVFSLSYAST